MQLDEYYAIENVERKRKGGTFEVLDIVYSIYLYNVFGVFFVFVLFLFLFCFSKFSQLLFWLAVLVHENVDSHGLKLLTRLRDCLSHLREHKFEHNFNDIIDPVFFCRTNSIESVEHFRLQ